MKLTLEEFYKLSNDERMERYKDLSDKDKYRVRLSMYGGAIVVGHVELTEENKKMAKKLEADFEEMLKKGTR